MNLSILRTHSRKPGDATPSPCSWQPGYSCSRRSPVIKRGGTLPIAYLLDTGCGVSLPPPDPERHTPLPAPGKKGRLASGEKQVAGLIYRLLLGERLVWPKSIQAGLPNAFTFGCKGTPSRTGAIPQQEEVTSSCWTRSQSRREKGDVGARPEAQLVLDPSRGRASEMRGCCPVASEHRKPLAPISHCSF